MVCTWSVILIGFSGTSPLGSTWYLLNNWGMLNNNIIENWFEPRIDIPWWKVGEWSSKKYFCWWWLMICLQSQVRLMHQSLFVVCTASNITAQMRDKPSDQSGYRLLKSIHTSNWLHHLTLKMTSAHAVETSINTKNSPPQDSPQLDGQMSWKNSNYWQ